MTSSRKKVKLSNGLYNDLFGYLMPCPHLHFNMDVINREALSREQHINLLATPKGYRWEELSKKKDGEPPTYTNKPRVICGGRRLKKEEKTYIQNFLAELWTLFTPDLESRLKGLLMNEFGMSPMEAEEFLVEQRKINVKRSSTVGVSGNTWYCPANLTSVIYEKRENARRPCQKISPGVRHYWIKEFTQNMANSMNAYIMTMLSVKRTKRIQCFSEVILQLICSVIGEEFTLDSPKTKLQRLCVFVADRLGVLLGGITCTGDAQMTEILRKLEEKEKEIPPRIPSPKEPMHEEPGKVKEKDRKKKEEKEKERKKGDEIEKIGEEAESEEDEIADVIEEVPEEGIQEEVSVVEEEEEGGVGEGGEGEGEEEEEEEGEEEKEEEEFPEEEEPEVVEEIPEFEGEENGFEIEKSVEDNVFEEPPAKPTEEETPIPSKVQAEEEKDKEPAKEELPQKIPETDIMGVVVTWISGTEPEETSRQKDLDEIIRNRLEDSIPSSDAKIQVAINTVSGKVSTWVDKLVSNVEKEFGRTRPPLEPKTRPAFRIKRDYGGVCYNVKEIPSDVVLQKVIEGRSQPAKAMTGAITKRPVTSFKKPKGVADWASWATDVASVAENWAGWIDKTCTQLAETADKYKEGKLITKEDWVKIKKETANKVIEWRKNKLLLKEAAKLWEKKFKK